MKFLGTHRFDFRIWRWSTFDVMAWVNDDVFNTQAWVVLLNQALERFI